MIHSVLIAACLGWAAVAAGADSGFTDQQQPGAWEHGKAKVEEGWDIAKEAATRTSDKARQGWEATKEGADKAVDWTEEKAKQGWEATKRGLSGTVDNAR